MIAMLNRITNQPLLASLVALRHFCVATLTFLLLGFSFNAQAATTTTLTTSATTAVVGVNVTLTASVAGVSPTGNVVFKDGTTTIGTVATTGTTATRTAVLSTNFTTVGSHSITAAYAGDADDTASTSTAKTVTATIKTTTSTLTVNPSNTAVGANVDLTVSVAGYTPTGTVTFKDGATVIGTGTLVGTGTPATVTISTSFSTAASHSITAVYAGDANDKTSTATAKTVTVTKAVTSTVLTAPASAPLSQSIILTATVTGYTPTGTVTFKEGTATLGTGTLTGTGTTTTATLSKSFSTLGVHSITAVTTGDANDATSTSTAIDITIMPATTTTTVTISPSTANLDQSVTLTASVAGLTPTGNVTFKDGTTILATVATTGSGTTRTASFSTSFSTVGAHSITAEYDGDADDTAGTSAVNNLAITTPTSAVLSANPTPAVINSNVILSTSVTGLAPTGTVTFKDGVTTLGTGTLSSTSATTANATLTTSFSSTGNHSLSAVYSGDANNLTSSTTTALGINITAVPTINITAPVNNADYAGPTNVVLTANVTDNATITQVTFYDGLTLLGNATRQGTSNSYVFNWSSVALGSYTLSAVATLNNNATIVSSPIQITVSTGTTHIYYIHTDQLDTPRLITDSSNNPVWRWDNNDPFANNVPNDDPNGTGNHFEFNQRLPGQYADKETNNYYNYFRDYDPSTGRYIESDPIGLSGGINTYAYVDGNPLMYVDPLGQNAAGAAIGGRVGSVVGGVVGEIVDPAGGGILGSRVGAVAGSILGDLATGSTATPSSGDLPTCKLIRQTPPGSSLNGSCKDGKCWRCDYSCGTRNVTGGGNFITRYQPNGCVQLSAPGYVPGYKDPASCESSSGGSLPVQGGY